MKVRFSRGALGDLAEILDYIAARNPQAAARLSRQFEDASELIGFMPDIGSETSRKGFRRIVVGNYLMVYRVEADAVTVYYVRHGARQRPWEGENP